MIELPEESWSAVLTAILDAPRAYQTAAELAATLDRDEADVSLILEDLIVHGLIQRWVRPGKPDAATLTPFAAEGLGVGLAGDGLAGRLRWAPKGDPSRRPARPGPSARLATEAHAEALARLEDPKPGPAEVAGDADEAERSFRGRKPRPLDQLPRPRILITGSESTWTEAERTRARRKPAASPPRCSACRGERLGPLTYCLRCNRWGLDGVARDARAREREQEREREREQERRKAAS